MKLEIVKQKSKGRIIVFQINGDLEYIQHRIKEDKNILSIWEIIDGKRQSTPLIWKLNKDKLLSQQGSWKHIEKYSSTI